MTISTTVAETRYNGTGNQTLFPTSFKFLQNSHVTVILRDTNGDEQTWVEGTHYALSGAGDENGGTVSVNTSPTDYTPATGETLVITRIIPETQETDYPEGGAFPASAHEAALDLLTMMIQKHSAEILRALIFPISDPATAIASLPSSTSRANKFLAFDATGKPVASAGLAGESEVPVSAFMETVLDDVTAAAARSTLGLAIGTDVLAPDGDGSSLSGVQASDAALASLAGLSLASGDVLYATAADTLARLAKGTDGQVLTLSSGLPGWTDNSSPFTKEYVSSPQTITSGGLLTLAHGLGVKPKLVLAYVELSGTQTGFAGGDRLYLTGGIGSGGGGANQGALLWCDEATNIKVRFGSSTSAINAIRADTGASVSLTNTEWEFYVEAWA